MSLHFNLCLIIDFYNLIFSRLVYQNIDFFHKFNKGSVEEYEYKVSFMV